ncbi:ribonuclease H-like domain-containing protein [Ureibacillus thermophilus]|uniref:Exonuclease n=1 Tax=Ureibacillus thermophilus TaxID=367743 RepID=A0A4P6US62_9BACL|nr:ribonuclease H-like domain-containing protein [Ureibacillus thermophilus]QBK25884.1 exonuclease [Ureibacillus thermophilus]
MSYENKIMQLKKMLGKKKTEECPKPSYPKPEKPAHIDEWEKAGLSIVENDFGVLVKRQVRYPISYKHGRYKLEQFFHVVEKWEKANLEHPYAIHYGEKVLFFDTETTGLKGVGTHIFLLGLLEVDEEEFVLNQYVLADPANEAAFLFESKLWKQGYTIVTYNGKSFDWPMLQMRWTFHKNYLPKLQIPRQIDLFHSSKRIWKNHLEKVKLMKVEEEKLGFKRENDIPGFLAPIIYADAVKSGDATGLMKVLQHNEWDILSLIVLYIHSTKLLLDQQLQDEAITYTNIGKWYKDLKELKQSEQVLLTVTEHFDEKETGLAYYYLAFQQKRNKQFKESIVSFQKAIHTIDGRKKLEAYEQLAMLYEHQMKDVSKAMQYTIKGIEMLQESDFLSEKQKKSRLEKWDKRLQRLKTKRGKYS